MSSGCGPLGRSRRAFGFVALSSYSLAIGCPCVSTVGACVPNGGSYAPMRTYHGHLRTIGCLRVPRHVSDVRCGPFGRTLRTINIVFIALKLRFFYDVCR
ncbi:hypothetical protein K523DRAFT_325738 [Schizophyllum commune Tattone D]|nr:hypothetical protein K523DRAFT_325738 [Schizophyllum commune Tattone D]